MNDSPEFWFSALDWESLTPPRPWPSALKSTIFPPCPQWLERDPLKPLKKDRKVLMERGRVALGALVQGNFGLYGPGAADLPAYFVWSEAPFFRENPLELMVLARRLVALRDKKNLASDVQTIADLVTNEMARPLSQSIPESLSEGKSAFLSSVLLWRAQLPGGILSGHLFPFLVLPEVTPCVILLPSCFWPDVLKDA